MQSWDEVRRQLAAEAAQAAKTSRQAEAKARRHQANLQAADQAVVYFVQQMQRRGKPGLIKSTPPVFAIRRYFSGVEHKLEIEENGRYWSLTYLSSASATIDDPHPESCWRVAIQRRWNGSAYQSTLDERIDPVSPMSLAQFQRLLVEFMLEHGIPCQATVSHPALAREANAAR